MRLLLYCGGVHKPTLLKRVVSGLSGPSLISLVVSVDVKRHVYFYPRAVQSNLIRLHTSRAKQTDDRPLVRVILLDLFCFLNA